MRSCAPVFDALTGDFETVAYGGVEPDAATVARARDGWRELLSGRGRPAAAEPS